MNKNLEKVEWLKTVVAIVSLLGLVLSYFFIKNDTSTNDAFKSLLEQLVPEFIASLITVLVIYFVFIKKGISANENMIEEIVSRLNSNFPVKGGFITHAESNALFNIKTEFGKAKQIDMLGYSFVGLISDHFSDLLGALKQGCNVRILIIKPKSSAESLIEKNMNIKDMELDLQRVIERIVSIKKEINKTKGSIRYGNFEIRLMDWIPGSALLITDRNANNGKMKIKFYAIDVETDHINILTHMVLYAQYNPDMFNYFVFQFESMWSKSSEYLHNE
jgi:hypothetical protein